MCRSPTLLVILLTFYASSSLAEPQKAATEARLAETELDYVIAVDLWMLVITDPETPEPLLIEAHVRSGILQKIQDNDTAARLHFIQVLQLDPDHQLGGEQPPKVTGFFEMVRSERSSGSAAEPEATTPIPQSVGVVQPSVPAAPEDASSEVSWAAIALAASGAAIVGAGVVAAAVTAALAGGAALVNQQATSVDIQLERERLYDTRDGLVVGAAVLGVAAGAGLLGGGLAAVGGGVLWAYE